MWLLDGVGVARPGGVGRPRKRLESLCADKAYGSRANRAALWARRIPHDIPEKDDQIGNRVRKGSRGGRPPDFRPERYKRRNHIERLMNRRSSSGRSPPGMTSLPVVIGPPSRLLTSSSGYAPSPTTTLMIQETRPR